MLYNLYNFIVINFAPLTGLLFLLIFLFSNFSIQKSEQSEKEVQHSFLLLCFLELTEMVVYSIELWLASLAEPTLWRILMSAIGYSIRPVLLLCIFRLTMRRRISDRMMLLFSIPAILNAVAAFSAFFTDIVYSYNEANEFIRGRFGYTTHVVLFFYLICIFILSLRKNGREHYLESIIVFAICLVIILAIVLEAVFSVRTLGRTAIVLSTISYYLYFQTQVYREGIQGYMEQTINSQKEHLREMNIIGVLAKEYVTVCYVDVEKNQVTPYRMDPFIDEQYGETLRSGCSFEQAFRAYVSQDVYEEDKAFFLTLVSLQDMLAYLRLNGNLSCKYRVCRDDTILYCEMRAELVKTDTGTEDIIFGFSNNDTRVRREMVYQSIVQQEMDKVEEAKNSLSGIAALAKQLQEAIEDKLSSL